MSKRIPYIIGGVMALLILLLIILHKTQKEQVFDPRQTFNRKDKIPYGTYVAYQGLSSLYPSASISSSRKEPGSWDSLSMYDGGQALVIISRNFDVNEYEMKKLISFAEAGNDVFISTIDFGYTLKNETKCDVNQTRYLSHELEEERQSWDTMKARLLTPPFDETEMLTYPGQPFNLCFSSVDSTHATVIGNGINDNANFIHLKAGKGNMYVHLSPILFTNYFLLHKNNIRYYEQALSVIAPGTRRIVWDEYFMNKRYTPPSTPNWMSAFMKIRSFKFALLVAILTLILYAIMEMRRKQRIIPVLPQPVNDSLEFVKTIGRLYHEKGDHANLMRKMSSYFLEHVRTRYNIPTRMLNEEFVINLHHRSGYSEQSLSDLVSSLQQVALNPTFTDKELTQFHKQLDDFYSAT